MAASLPFFVYNYGWEESWKGALRLIRGRDGVDLMRI